MKITIPTQGGYLPDKYAKYSDVKLNGNPIVSFPVEFAEVPKNVRSLALVFVDFDSIPVCGFAWIHWLAANIAPDTVNLAEDASRIGAFGMVQGSNSCASPFVGERDKNVTHRYIGPTPPDKDHIYKVTAYALDCVLDVQDGFFLNEMLRKMDGHIIEKASAEFIGKA